MEFEKLVSPSLKDLFITHIEAMILSGELPVGQQLPPERQLAQSMGVSRAVVNSGVAELERRGFLEVRPRVGTFVTDYRRAGTLDTLKSIMTYNRGRLRNEEIRSILEIRDALDKLAAESDKKERFRVRIDSLQFSFSGIENKVKQQVAQHKEPADIARFTLETIASLVRRVTDRAMEQYPGLPVVCSGGVASNSILRKYLYDAVFAPPAYSTDNAMGTAVLTARQMDGGH